MITVWARNIFPPFLFLIRIEYSYLSYPKTYLKNFGHLRPSQKIDFCSSCFFSYLFLNKDLIIHVLKKFHKKLFSFTDFIRSLAITAKKRLNLCYWSNIFLIFMKISGFLAFIKKIIKKKSAWVTPLFYFLKKYKKY
jgi:hypothetical protein